MAPSCGERINHRISSLTDTLCSGAYRSTPSSSGLIIGILSSLDGVSLCWLAVVASRQDHPNRGAGLESKQTLSKHDKRKLRSNVVILRDAPRRRCRIMSLGWYQRSFTSSHGQDRLLINEQLLQRSQQWPCRADKHSS